MSSSLIKSKERVASLGEVFTPEYIVHDMCALIPEKSWSDPTMICLEPTCGNGNFVVAIVQKKLDAGLSPYDAVNTTFGMDIMRDNIEDCRRRVFHLVHPLLGGSRKKENEMRCLVVNNFFPVKDSLEFMKSGKWEAKKFFAKDPTGGELVLPKDLQVGLLKAIVDKGILQG